MFQGSIVALVTPMNTDGSIDKKSLHDLIEWHIAEKTDGLVIAGSTGESATLSTEEHADLIATVVKQAAKRIPVIAGTGSNCTKHTIELTQNAKKAGADACLIVTPYYNKPPQNGLYAHFKTVAEKVSIPIVLYNVPGRTVINLLPETTERLSKIPNIIGIKEEGKVERVIELKKRCPTQFMIFSGDDIATMDLMINGAKGGISVVANVAPRKMHDMCHATLKGDKALAQQLNNELLPLHKNLFLEVNPIPVKWALYRMSKIPSGIRLPLIPLDSKYHSEVEQSMKLTGIQLKDAQNV